MKIEVTKSGDIILLDTLFDLKVVASREIYIRKSDDRKFVNLEEKTPYGMSQLEKTKYLLDINEGIKKYRR